MPIFVRHFRPQICAADYHCLGIKHKDPEAWLHNIFQLRIERIPNPPANAKLWAYYKVTGAKTVSIQSLRIKYNRRREAKEFQETYNQGVANHRENVKEGCVGTITTFVMCDSDGEIDRECISWAGHDMEGGGEAGMDWYGDLVKAVQEGSERLSAR
ncbi:hypothetical protein EUX98_g5110 [Antrodiella citrinella]|uniref:Uncharacterized protein n=1 Tax=Antrodiella citrinella TaxID=2447956 RepID=A0A4S4MSC4_9APHY|nr:hypothetical protein EUX98_g5110 [Antrodiella citrinella]